MLLSIIFQCFLFLTVISKSTLAAMTVTLRICQGHAGDKQRGAKGRRVAGLERKMKQP